MSEEKREAERQWAHKMAEIEEEFGPVVSGGPRRGKRSAAAVRARTNVRFLARAVRKPRERAA